ncbi:AGAP010470-PA, partial [Anopheles gambiae str. PEST]
LVAIIGCAAAQTTTTQSPASDPCVETATADGFLPHPTECTKYFSCYGGKGYEQTCPDQKYFDPINLLCDIPENVDCVVNNCPPNEIVYLPVNGSCTDFIRCIGGVAYESSCQPGLFFDPALQECNLESEVDCVVNPCTQPPPDPPILEIYPNPGNCKEYILCLNGEGIVRQCAPGLFFDEQATSCVAGFEGDGCTVKNVPCTIGPCTGNTALKAVEIPNICTSYTLCVGETAYNRTCAEGTLFDSAYGDCVLASNSSCVENPCLTTDPATALPTTLYPVLS